MLSLESIKTTLSYNGKYWIAFTGDSITSCEWVHPNWRDILIYVVQNELIGQFSDSWRTPSWGIRGFNFGFDGATTKDIVSKIDDILTVKPNIVIGIMGGNDPTFGISVADSIQNISKIVNSITQTGSKVIWCNSTPAGKGSNKNPEYKPYAEAFLQIPNSENFKKIDMFNLFQQYNTEKFFTFESEENIVENIKEGEIDLQHPNQLGNAYIAKIILKEVFEIEFDPEKYIKDTLDGKKLPEY